MNNYEILWNKVLERSKESLESHVYDSFVLDSYIYNIDKDKIYIATNSSIAANLLNTKFLSLFETIVQAITQTNYKLVFEKEETLKNNRSLTKNKPNNKTFFKDSKLNPRFTFDNFVVGPSNKEAQQASLIVASSPGIMYNPLFLYSDSGLGKTHLLHAIGNYIKENNPTKHVLVSSTSSFIDEYIKGARGEKDLNSLKDYIKSFDVLLIDDIQGLIDHKKTEQYFFDLFNYFIDCDKQIVITCDKLPNELKGLEARLVTRFSQGLQSKISTPDISTSVNILKYKIEQSNLDLSKFDEDALHFIAENKSSSVRELEGALNKLLSYTINFMPTNHIDLKITIDALQDILSPSSNKGINEKQIINEVANYFNLTLSQILGNSQIKSISNARHIAMYLIRYKMDLPYKKIGSLFGGKDHSTVISAITKVEKLVKSDPSMGKIVKDLSSKINI